MAWYPFLKTTCLRAGIALVAHLLQQRHHKHLTVDLLHAMEALLRAVGPSEGLHTAVLQRLLLNLRLWASAPLPIQRSFQALLLKLAKVDKLCRMHAAVLRHVKCVSASSAFLAWQQGLHQCRCAGVVSQLGVQHLLYVTHALWLCAIKACCLRPGYSCDAYHQALMAAVYTGRQASRSGNSSGHSTPVGRHASALRRCSLAGHCQAAGLQLRPVACGAMSVTPGPAEHRTQLVLCCLEI